MITNTILIIGTVWPEPNSTAAGNRMLQLIEQFQTQRWEIIFASTALKNEYSYDFSIVDIKTEAIVLNNVSFDDFVKKLNPTVVVFDRFMTEEQFGWRIAENCPKCLRILDTEDLHFVRNTRFENFKKKSKTTENDYFKSDIAKREIASIYRCDVSLIISKYEYELLVKTFKIDSKILYYLPFLLNTISEDTIDNYPNFDERNHFISIGNFRHEPNWNAVVYLKETLWPLIKKQLPYAQLHVYGSYIPEKAMQLHNPKQHFFVKGRAVNAKEVLQKARVLVAPLRFGAGIKGKLTDAMECGTPSVTTSIGAEGMHEKLEWNGIITDNEKEFVEAAVLLYTSNSVWKKSQENGIKIINQIFPKVTLGPKFIEHIIKIQKDLEQHRTENFIGEILQIQSMKSQKFMSQWIEEKNKNKTN